MTEPIPSQYESLLGEIKERIHSAQLVALRQVNREMITLYSDIGRLIVARQEGDTWGKSVVANLARDLHAEFPGTSGFSAANLWRMKLFYESYGLNEKLAPLVREISWSHNVVILEKCKDTAEREFYIRSAQRFGWTRNVLVHQIENGTLKIGEFLPEYVGKMQFYLAALDDKVKLEGESPSIGIILCKSKDRTIVEYALRRALSPIGIAAYEITDNLPAEFRGELPAPAQVAKLLENISE